VVDPMNRTSQGWWIWLGVGHDGEIYRHALCEEPPKTARQHWVLGVSDRRQGFLRPLRYTYTHLACESDTVMSTGSARLWAKNPRHATVTWCACCQADRPVREFVWLGSAERVGS
jgi:hypothetical protein